MNTRVLPGADNFSSSQATVNTTGTQQIVPARPNRDTLVVTNLGTTDVWVGALGVQPGTGELLIGIRGAWISMAYNGVLYGAAASGTATVSVGEIY